MQYTTREAASILGLSTSQIRSHARAGFLEPGRGSRGELLFSFQDLVLLRAAAELREAKIPPRRILRSLRRLREQLPAGRPLTTVRISTDGESVVVQEGGSAWVPDSGQGLFSFAVADLAEKVAPMAREVAEKARLRESLTAEEWYDLGCDLEIGSPDDAVFAYRKVLEIEPHHADATVNLGRLVHEAGDLEEAERLYRSAAASEPSNQVAVFNLGVVLEDERREREAIAAYRRALALDPDLADAHYNLARLYEKQGQQRAALRHLKQYRQLVRSS